jgi:hypothetical protein
MVLGGAVETPSKRVLIFFVAPVYFEGVMLMEMMAYTREKERSMGDVNNFKSEMWEY